MRYRPGMCQGKKAKGVGSIAVSLHTHLHQDRVERYVKPELISKHPCTCCFVLRFGQVPSPGMKSVRSYGRNVQRLVQDPVV